MSTSATTSRAASRVTNCAALLTLLGTFAACDTLEGARGSDSLLAAFSPPTPTEAATWATDPYNPDLRYRGTLLLANATFGGEPVYVELYEDHIDDPDSNVRAAATRGLANHGDPSHVEQILTRLDDDDEFVRREAARALQRLHNPIAVDDLLVASREPDLERPDVPAEADPEVRARAADALGQYAESRVVEALIGSLADRSLAVNLSTRRALSTLTGQDFAFDRRDWLDWYDSVDDPFAARRPYTYPVFQRDKKFVEYLPFVPGPPNEPESTPVGLPPVQAFGTEG